MFHIAAATSADLAIGTPIAIVLLVLGFGFVIFVHELGHFLAAKAVGIKCSQFAIGFGHAIACYRKGIGLRVGTTEPEFHRRVHAHLEGRGALPDPTTGAQADAARATWSPQQIDAAAAELGLGETEYRLNWLPLGGYVKMLGQEDAVDQSGVASQDPRSFSRKPIWARFIVISAGVVMNAIFAVVFFVIAFMYGVEFPPAIVGQVLPGSPAAAAVAVDEPTVVGLRPGDRVLSVNGEPPVDFFDIAVTSALTGRGEAMTLEVERPGGYGVEGGRYLFRIEPTEGAGRLRAIGVMPPQAPRLLARVDSNLESLWRERFGEMNLRPGMELTQIEGQPVSGSYELDRALRASRGEPLSLTFTDDAGPVTVTQQPHTALSAEAAGPSGDSSRPPHLLGLVPPLEVVSVVPGMPADGKLLSGDLVLKINSIDLPSWPQVMEVIPNAGDDAVELLVLREGKRQTVSLTPRKGKIGVLFDYALDTNYVARVLAGSPFVSLELITPARIESIAGQRVESYTDIRKAISQSQGPMEVAYTLPLPGENAAAEKKVIDLTSEQREALAALPWRLELPPFQDLQTIQRADNAVQAVRMGFHKSWVMMIQTYQTLRALFSATVPVSELRGPVGIADAGTQFAKRGWTYLMFFLAVISVNLAVLNFLPIPILDGGLAALLLAEKARGRPVPPNVHSALNLIGAALLLSLVLFVTYNDIWRLINS